MYTIFLIFFFLGGHIFAANTAEIQEKLTSIFSGHKSSDLFNLKVDGYFLAVQIKNVGSISKDSNTQIVVMPEGHDNKNEEDPCLFLNIRPDNTGYLSWISTIDDQGHQKRCGNPAIRKKGKYLLSFVDKIAVGLNLSRVSLNDVSSIWCEKNQSHLPLRLLNLTKKSLGWYEKNGYLPEDIKVHKESFSALINYNMESILTAINSITNTDDIIQELESTKQVNFQFKSAIQLAINYWNNFLRRKELLQKYIKVPLTTFSDFAAPLYKADGSTCDIYSELMDLIFPPLLPNSKVTEAPTAQFGKYFPWYPIYKAFDGTARKLVKKFDQDQLKSNKCPFCGY